MTPKQRASRGCTMVEAVWDKLTQDERLAFQDRLEDLLYPETPKDLDAPAKTGTDAFPESWSEEKREEVFQAVMDEVSDESIKDLTHLYVSDWTEEDWLEYDGYMVEE